MPHIPYWLRIALREIRNTPSFTLATILSVAVALVGFATIGMFADSFSRQLRDSSLLTTGAEFIATSTQPFSDDDLTKIKSEIGIVEPISRRTSFFTMVNAHTDTRLAIVNAIDDQYPVRGIFRTDNGASPSQLNESASVLLDPELGIQLGVKLGDEVTIGLLKFKFAGTVLDDTGSAAMGFNVAPRAYIATKYVPDTGLVQHGSRIRYEVLLPKLNAPPPPQGQLKTLRKQLSDQNIKINYHTEESATLGRLIRSVSDFLTLMSLVGLLMGGIGSWFLIRSFIAARSEEVAILKCIGAPANHVVGMFAAQLAALVSIAALLAVVVSTGVSRLLPVIMAGLLPPDFRVTVSPSVIALTFAVALVLVGIFATPTLRALSYLKPIILLRGEAESGGRAVSVRWLILQLLFLWGFACFGVRSFVTGSIFTVAIIVTVLVTVGLFTLMRRFSGELHRIKSLSLRLPLLQVLRQPSASLTAFVCLSISTFFLNLPFQLGKTISHQISSPDGIARRPDLFLFDIQDEQIKSLQEFIASQGLALENVSPLVRARLLRVDGVDVGGVESGSSFRTREGEEEESARNRSYNLSSRSTLASSEEIIAGQPFSGRFTGSEFRDVEMSLERGFAERLGVKIGATLEFDLQGVEVQGKVINLREVKWTSFEPNFFVMLQPGVLDDAPKSLIGAIPGVSTERKPALQREIVQKFPNVSLIDVTKTTRRIVDLTNQIQVVILFMSMITAFAAVGVLMAIALQSMRTRTRSQTIFKVLGMSSGSLQMIGALEFLILTTFSVLIGGALSLTVCAALSRWQFSARPMFDWLALTGISLAIPAVTTVFCLLTVRTSFAVPPRTLLADN